MATVQRNGLEIILCTCLPTALHTKMANKVTASATARKGVLVKFRFTIAQAI